MRIGVAGPISTDSIAALLNGSAAGLPRGYYGAPLLGTLIRSLLKRGHVVTAFTTSSDLPVVQSGVVTAEGDRFKIIYCPERPRAFRFSDGHWGRAVDAFRFERNVLRRAMQDENPDLIHAHWTYEFALAALDSGLPHVVTCHDAPQVVLRYTPNLYRLVRYFMAKGVLARARCLTAVSPYLQKMVEGYAKVPVTVVPNPLPDEVIGSSPRARRYEPERTRIAMVVNGWGKRKNPEPALRAFALLRKQIPKAELQVMGSDFEPGGRAESWAKAHGVAEGVCFLGPQPYRALLAHLADSDLLLHPALEETFGMSIAEAMAMGVPVVGGEHSGAVPWVIGDGGIVTDVSNPVAMCDTMHYVLKDGEVNSRLRTNARENAVRRFAADVVADEYINLYQNTMNLERGTACVGC